MKKKIFLVLFCLIAGVMLTASNCPTAAITPSDNTPPEIVFKVEVNDGPIEVPADGTSLMLNPEDVVKATCKGTDMQGMKSLAIRFPVRETTYCAYNSNLFNGGPISGIPGEDLVYIADVKDGNQVRTSLDLMTGYRGPFGCSVLSDKTGSPDSEFYIDCIGINNASDQTNNSTKRRVTLKVKAFQRT